MTQEYSDYTKQKIDNATRSIEFTLKDVADHADSLAAAMIDTCCDDVTFKYGFDGFTMEIKLREKWEE